MAISFSPANTYNPADLCGICLEPLGGEEKVVAHDSDTNGTKIHQLHTSCIRKCVKIEPRCPLCRKEVNLKSLLSCSERVISAIKRSQSLPVVALIGTGLLAYVGTEVVVEMVAGPGAGQLAGIVAALAAAKGIQMIFGMQM